MSSKKRMGRRGWIALAALLGAAPLLWSNRSPIEADADAGEGPLLSARVETARLEDHYMVQSSFVGRVEAARDSELGFELGGLLRRVHVEEGDAVRPGQSLADLDTQRLRSGRAEAVASWNREKARLKEMEASAREEEIEQARADVERFAARAGLAKITLERSDRAARLKALSFQSRDEALHQEQAAAAELQAARERLRELENGIRAEQIEAQRAVVSQWQARIDSIDVDIAKSRLRAPFAGVVAARRADEGRVLSAGEPVIRLLEAGSLEVRVGVAADLANGLTPGAAKSVRVNGADYSATVRSVLPDRERQTRTVNVLLAVSEAQAKLRSGDLAELKIATRVDASGFWLPREALTESFQGLWSAYVVDEGKVARRELEILHTETDRVFVRGTLASGEPVIVAGVQRLTPGQRAQAID